MDKYKPVIGLEIHVELKTKSKMFCQCDADYFGKERNTNTCPVCLGMPGALPVPNRKAIEWALLIGRALNCSINKVSKFDRKHYFYPDLPKGYQISQYDEPFAVKGSLKINTKAGEKTFSITRVHLEEDTGKLMHSGEDTLIDYNRSSVPLVEIVTEPDFDNADDVKQFLEELHTIITYLNVSDADMEKGSMRLEPNISVKLTEATELPNYKVEVKNINSFNFVKRAIEYEVKRHIELLDKGQTPPQETRGFNDAKMITYSQRTKENAQDYRYFPEPDIPPIEFSDEDIKKIDEQLPELPEQKVSRYENEFGLKFQDAFTLTRDIKLAQYFEAVVKEFIQTQKESKSSEVAQKLANFIINKKLDNTVSVTEFVKKSVELLKPKETDSNLLEEVTSKVIANNPKVVEDYKSGKQNAVMFLVGQVMRDMKGQADAQTVKEALINKMK